MTGMSSSLESNCGSVVASSVVSSSDGSRAARYGSAAGRFHASSRDGGAVSSAGVDAREGAAGGALAQPERIAMPERVQRLWIKRRMVSPTDQERQSRDTARSLQR